MSVEERVVELQIIEVGIQGPMGPPGANGATGGLQSFLAGQILSGHRVVTANALGKLIYADCTIADHAAKVVGITIGSAAIDVLTQITAYGELTEPTWTWTAGQIIYLGRSGNLLTTPDPAAAFILLLGFALTPTKIFIHPREPIFI